MLQNSKVKGHNYSITSLLLNEEAKTKKEVMQKGKGGQETSKDEKHQERAHGRRMEEILS